MKIAFTEQQKNFPRFLEEFRKLPVLSYDRKMLREDNSTVQICKGCDLQTLDLSFFFDYTIFPPQVMNFLTEWKYNGREIMTGDTIVQEVYFPPFRAFSQKLIFGVRINEIIREEGRIGFSYETLRGHVERGISTFTLEQNEENIIFRIHTFSAPGNYLLRKLGRILSLPYQAYCTQKALENVKNHLKPHVSG